MNIEFTPLLLMTFGVALALAVDRVVGFLRKRERARQYARHIQTIRRHGLCLAYYPPEDVSEGDELAEAIQFYGQSGYIILNSSHRIVGGLHQTLDTQFPGNNPNSQEQSS